MTELTLINGESAATVSLFDRGLAYGDGVFETIRVVAGRAIFLDRHLLRLYQGCKRLGINVDDALLETEIRQLLAMVDAELSVLKIIITRGGQRRGYGVDRQALGNRYLQCNPLDEQLYQRMLQGVKLRVCHHRLPINPPLAGIKHLNRLDNVMARAEWCDGEIDEGIMLDMSGLVIEGTMSNLFLVVDGELVTPALHRCGVEGVVRGLILEQLAADIGVPAQQKDIVLDEVRQADEVFICNSLIGICPVTALDSISKVPGPVTGALQAALAISS